MAFYVPPFYEKNAPHKREMRFPAENICRFYCGNYFFHISVPSSA